MSEELYTALIQSFAGITIVFSSLIGISILISFMRRIDEKFEERKNRVSEPEPEKIQTLDNTTLVLIAAAAKAVLRQKNIKIRSVRRIVSRDSRGAGWAMQGRSVLHGSHVMNVNHDKNRG